MPRFAGRGPGSLRLDLAEIAFIGTAAHDAAAQMSRCAPIVFRPSHWEAKVALSDAPALHRHDPIPELVQIPCVLMLDLHHHLLAQHVQVIILVRLHSRADIVQSRDAENLVVFMRHLRNIPKIMLERRQAKISIYLLQGLSRF
jgi:hypothetical protein